MTLLEKVIEYMIVFLVICSIIGFVIGMYDFINLVYIRG
jgi:hypothetical protein